MSQDHKIFVTQPSLPPLEEFIPYLEKIWDSKFLTNGGPMHQALEEALCKYLNVPYISLFNNATEFLYISKNKSSLHSNILKNVLLENGSNSTKSCTVILFIPSSTTLSMTMVATSFFE